MNPFKYDKNQIRRYRRLIREFGKVKVHAIIKAASNPRKGLDQAEWTLLTT